MSATEMEAAAYQMRTAPLCGLRTRNRLMHDELPFTKQEAIQRQAGQASSSTNAFNSLSATQKSLLMSFLDSLQVQISGVPIAPPGQEEWTRPKGADGVVGRDRLEFFEFDPPPRLRDLDADATFLDRAATPPGQEGQWHISNRHCSFW